MILDPDAALWLLVTFVVTGAVCWCVAAVLAVVFLVRTVLRATAKVTGRHRSQRRRPVLTAADAAHIRVKLRDGLTRAGVLPEREAGQ